jgi:hypothetical protein
MRWHTVPGLERHEECFDHARGSAPAEQHRSRSILGRHERREAHRPLAVAELTDDRHVGQLYELISARLLTFQKAIREIAHAVGREIQYVQISSDHYASLAREGKGPSGVHLAHELCVPKSWTAAMRMSLTVSTARWDADRETLPSTSVKPLRVQARRP